MELNLIFINELTCRIKLIGQFWKGEDLTLFRKQTLELLEKGIKKIIVDLFRVSFINSQGLGLLATLFTQAKKRECELIISRPKGSVKEMIELSEFNMFMRVIESEDELK